MDKKIIFAAFVLASVFCGTAPAAPQTGPKCPDCADLARTASEMFEAGADNDWERLYGMILPATRKKFSFAEYVASPHFLPPNFEKRPAVVSPEPPPPPAESRPHYVPLIFGYKIKGFLMDRGRRNALVVSELTVPIPPIMGHVVMEYQTAEFWKKYGGRWYFDFERTYNPRGRGAVEKDLPDVFDAEALSLELAERALLREGQERLDLIDRALWLNPLGITKYLVDKKADAGRLPLQHLHRALKGARRNLPYFSLARAAGYWFAVAGAWTESYEGYRMAASLNPFDEQTRAGAFLAAAGKEDWPAAAEEFRLLLETLAVTGAPMPGGMERFIGGDCRACAGVEPATTLEIGVRLAAAGKGPLAASVFRAMLLNGPLAKKGLGQLADGKETALAEIAGPAFAAAAERLSQTEIAMVLDAAGFDFVHPGDLPAGFPPPAGGALEFQSAPAWEKREFEPAFNSSHSPAVARIVWNGVAVDGNSHQRGGWVMASLSGGRVSGRYYPDDDDGGTNRAFAEETGKLPKGTPVAIARAPGGPGRFPAAVLSALESIGIDARRIFSPGQNIGGAGVKGSPAGNARVFAEDFALRKTLVAANAVPAKPVRPFVTVSRGRGGPVLHFAKP